MVRTEAVRVSAQFWPKGFPIRPNACLGEAALGRGGRGKPHNSLKGLKWEPSYQPASRYVKKYDVNGWRGLLRKSLVHGLTCPCNQSCGRSKRSSAVGVLFSV